MANNRMYLTCKKCNNGIAIAKFYPSGGYISGDGAGWGQFIEGEGVEMIGAFFEEHKHDYDKRAFNSEISIKYFTEPEWKTLLSQKNNLAVNILLSHVIVFGFEKFVETAWRDYYGLD